MSVQSTIKHSIHTPNHTADTTTGKEVQKKYIIHTYILKIQDNKFSSKYLIQKNKT